MRRTKIIFEDTGKEWKEGDEIYCLYPDFDVVRRSYKDCIEWVAEEGRFFSSVEKADEEIDKIIIPKVIDGTLKSHIEKLKLSWKSSYYLEYIIMHLKRTIK